MAKQFDDDQVAALQRIIRAHEHGLDPNTGEWFAPIQKPLTYSELAEFRKIIHERLERKKAAVDAGVRAAKQAAGLLETFLPFKTENRAGETYSRHRDVEPTFDRVKTSALLNDAANMINETIQAFGAAARTYTHKTTFLGKDWQQLVHELRARARAFKEIEDTA